MNLNDTVWKLNGQSGNFGWFVKRYIEKLVEKKFKSNNKVPGLLVKNNIHQQKILQDLAKLKNNLLEDDRQLIDKMSEMLCEMHHKLMYTSGYEKTELYSRFHSMIGEYYVNWLLNGGGKEGSKNE